MKRLFMLLAVGTYLFFADSSLVLAQDELTIEDLTEKTGLEFRCADFLNLLPQTYTRNTKTSFGTNDTAVFCEYLNKDKESSGNQLDIDIIPGRVAISGDKKAAEAYQRAKEDLLTNQSVMRLKIIAEDTVGEKSYVAQGSAFANTPSKGYTATSLNLVFFQGPCFVRMSYSSRLNDAVYQYHPDNRRTSRYDNLHPEFDHGFKRMKEEMETIAGNIAGMCTNSKIIVQNPNKAVPDTVTPISKTEEEEYNACVDKCFLNKVLSICSDNNSMNICTSDLVDARKNCLRTCRPPAQFRSANGSNQGKIITKQDYGDQKVILLNGSPVTIVSSSNSPFVNYSPVIEKADFISAKTNKPQKVSGKNLEMWVADIKGDTHVSRATESASLKWDSAKIGDILSEGERIFVPKDTSLVIGTDIGVIKLPGLSSLSITKASVADENGKKHITLYIDLHIGTIEADIEKGQYELDMQITTPSSITRMKGTHFFVVFDDDKRIAETGVFGGEVEDESLVTGQKLVLVPLEDNNPRIVLVPLEVNAPTPAPEPTIASTEKSETPRTSGSGFLPILLLLVTGGIGLYLHKKGRLIPLYKKCGQKISGLFIKTNNKNPEKEEN